MLEKEKHEESMNCFFSFFGWVVDLGFYYFFFFFSQIQFLS